MRFRRGTSVTLLREHRGRTGDVTLVEEGTIVGCGWSPSIQGVPSSTETAWVHTQVVTGRTLYLPPGSGVTATHRVRFPDGTVWEVVGDVGVWRSPLTGWTPGDHVSLTRVTG